MGVRSDVLVVADQAVARWMETVRTPGLDRLARGLTSAGGIPVILTLVATMLGWWWKTRQPRLAWVFLGTWGGGLILQAVLRFWVGQWRPDAVVPASMDLVTRYDLAGFTSGHALRSAFLYGWWSQALLRRRVWWASLGAAGCVALILLVGASRIYLRRHWLTDVVGAWLIAGVVLTVASMLQARGEAGRGPDA